MKTNLYKTESPIHINTSSNSISIIANGGKRLTIITTGIDFHHQLIVMNFANWYFLLDSVPNPLAYDEIIFEWVDDCSRLKANSYENGKLVDIYYHNREKMERMILSMAMENYAYAMFKI